MQDNLVQQQNKVLSTSDESPRLDDIIKKARIQALSRDICNYQQVKMGESAG